jgi:hypothetical protein
MRLSHNHILKLRNLPIAACLVFCAINSAQAQPDAARLWTTVGSAGTVDESSVGKVFFDHAIVQRGHVTAGPGETPTGAFVQPDSALIRYNVTAVDGLFCVSGPRLTVRYLATGGASQAIAKLIEVDRATGVETERLSFNSNGAPTNTYKLRAGAPACDPNFFRFDFRRNAYYIEATLTGSSVIAVGAAGFQMIRIEFVGCPVP